MAAEGEIDADSTALMPKWTKFGKREAVAFRPVGVLVPTINRQVSADFRPSARTLSVKRQYRRLTLTTSREGLYAGAIRPKKSRLKRTRESVCSYTFDGALGARSRLSKGHLRFVIQILPVRSVMLKTSLSTATDMPTKSGSPMVISERREVWK